MTFVGSHADFAGHDLPGHPENQRRAQRILEHIARTPGLRELDRLEPDRPATDEELLGTHTQRLVLSARHGGGTGPAWLDPDTYVVPGSERAARLAARLSVQAALRALERDEAGFVAARPPGHHATRDRSMGFCLFNNVALAAHAALATPTARRVLIFDHDVHHGNGTQDIFWNDPRVVYQSFHLGGGHYPGTGRPDETGGPAAAGHTVNAPLQPGDGEAQVRSLLHHVFLPVAREFHPDLVLLSAGFDSLESDPLGGLRLSAPFFGEMVAQFRRVCPRVVAVLEGGYQVDRIPLAVGAELRAMTGEPTREGQSMEPAESEAALAGHLRGTWRGIG